MNQPANAIVVAVGYDGCDAALKFAVEEAQRTDSPVHLLQVTNLPDTVEYPGVYASGGMDVDADIERALATARKLAAGTPVTVTGERVEDRSHVSALVRHADRGRMVVLQHRRLSMPHRIVTRVDDQRGRRQGERPGRLGAGRLVEAVRRLGGHRRRPGRP